MDSHVDKEDVSFREESWNAFLIEVQELAALYISMLIYNFNYTR